MNTGVRTGGYRFHLSFKGDLSHIITVIIDQYDFLRMCSSPPDDQSTDPVPRSYYH